MSKNIIDAIYQKTKKLIKEKETKDNNLYKEKVINSCFESTTNMSSKDVLFFGNKNSIMNLDVQIFAEAESEISIYLNGVLIHKTIVCDNYFLGCKLYISDENILRFEVNSQTETCVKIIYSLEGNIKSFQNKLSKALKYLNKYYFANNNILSKSEDIMSITYNENNNNSIICDKMHDVNYLYLDTVNCVGIITLEYIDNKYYVKNGDMSIQLNDSNIRDCCVFSNGNQNICIVKLIGVNVVLDIYDVGLNLKNMYFFDNLKHLNLVSIKSLISDTSIAKFLGQSGSGYWYIIDVNVSKGEVISVRKIDYAFDAQLYVFNNKFYFVKLLTEGVVVDVFDVDFKSKINTYEFFNIQDAFMCDRLVYLNSNYGVQKVEFN